MNRYLENFEKALKSEKEILVKPVKINFIKFGQAPKLNDHLSLEIHQYKGISTVQLYSSVNQL